MDTLLEILKGIHPDIDFASNHSLIDEGILDSFDIITIIADISDKFDVTITANEIIPENFNSVDAMYALVERLLD